MEKIKNKIGIYKYKSSNINSLINALEMISIKYEVSENFSEIAKYKKIILPGVGNMKNFSPFLISELSKKINIFLEEEGIIYGICLGLQLLLDKNEEANINTTGFIKGDCISLKNKFDIKLNVGFQSLKFSEDHLKDETICNLFKGIDLNSKFYFLHKYFCNVSENKNYKVINTSVKNKHLPSLFIKKNILGTQFHPELSNNVGLKFLSNFSKL